MFHTREWIIGLLWCLGQREGDVESSGLSKGGGERGGERGRRSSSEGGTLSCHSCPRVPWQGTAGCRCWSSLSCSPKWRAPWNYPELSPVPEQAQNWKLNLESLKAKQTSECLVCWSAASFTAKRWDKGGGWSSPQERETQASRSSDSNNNSQYICEGSRKKKLLQVVPIK